MTVGDVGANWWKEVQASVSHALPRTRPTLLGCCILGARMHVALGLTVAVAGLLAARDWLRTGWTESGLAWSLALASVLLALASVAEAALARRSRTPRPRTWCLVALCVVGVLWLHGDPGRFLLTRLGSTRAAWGVGILGWGFATAAALGLAFRCGPPAVSRRVAMFVWVLYLGLDWGASTALANHIPGFPHHYHHITEQDLGDTFVSAPPGAPLHDLRGRPFAVPEEREGRLAVLLGGSTAWGHGLRQEEEADLGPRLAQALGAEGERWTCVVAAYPGFNSFHELQLFTTYFLSARPALVVSVTGWNDLHRYSATHRPGEYYLGRQMRFGLAHPFWFAALDSSLPRLILYRTGGLGGANFVPHNLEWTATHEANLAAFVRNERHLALACRGVGARFVCALQPGLLHKPTRAAEEAEALAAIPPEMQAVEERAFRTAAAQVGPAVEAAGGTFVDLTGVWAAEPAARFIDVAHWNAAGHADIARALVAVLRPEPSESAGGAGPPTPAAAP